MIVLRHRDYAIPPSDWHDNAHCWVGTNTKTGARVGLLCSADEVDAPALDRFVSYMGVLPHDALPAVPSELLVALRRGTPRMALVGDLSVRIETEDSLLTDLVSFQDYFDHIRDRVERAHLPDSNITLQDTYVPSRALLLRDKSVISDLEEYLIEWLQEPGRRHLAILGQYGQGKSTAALMFTYRLITSHPSPAPYVPILVTLRGRSIRNMTPLQILSDWAAPYRITARALEVLLIAGRLLLILDGFDEMDLVGDAVIRLSHFRVLWQLAYPGAKLLITGRPNFFFDTQERNAALRVFEPTGTDQPYCDVVRLLSFDLPQMRRALRSADNQTREEICALAASDGKFAAVASRPSLLFMLSALWVREGLGQLGRRINSAVVIGLFVEHLYGRQEAKEVGPDGRPFMALTKLQRAFFMEGIAAYMASRALPNQIGSSELDEVVRKLCEVVQLGLTTDAAKGEVSAGIVAPEQFREETVVTDVRLCGLLVDDPSRTEMLQFPHKSFMEYLVAHAFTNRVWEPRSMWVGAMRRVVPLDITELVRYPEATGFLAELLGERLLREDGDQRNRGIRGALGNKADRDRDRARKLYLKLRAAGSPPDRVVLDTISIGMRVEVAVRQCRAAARKQPLFRAVSPIVGQMVQSLIGKPMKGYLEVLKWLMRLGGESENTETSLGGPSGFAIVVFVCWRKACHSVGIDTGTMVRASGLQKLGFIEQLERRMALRMESAVDEELPK